MAQMSQMIHLGFSVIDFEELLLKPVISDQLRLNFGQSLDLSRLLDNHCEIEMYTQCKSYYIHQLSFVYLY